MERGRRINRARSTDGCYEPAWCARTLERLAQVREVDAGALGAAVVRNTRRCFSLD